MRSRSSLVLVDQVLSSASNVVPLVITAHYASVETYGRLAILITGAILSVTWFRATYGELILSARWADSGRLEATLPRMILMSFLLSPPIGGIFLMFGNLSIGDVILALTAAVCIPLLVSQDQLRLQAIARGDAVAAAVSDGAWLAVALVIQLFLVLLGWRGPSLLTAWFLAGAMAGAYLWLHQRGVKASGRDEPYVLRHHLQAGSANAAGAIAAFLITPISIALAGPSAVGYVRLGQLATSPLTFAAAASANLVLPSLSSNRLTVRSWRFFASGVGAAGATLSIAATFFFHEVLWPQAHGSELVMATCFLSLQAAIALLTAVQYLSLRTRPSGDGGYSGARFAYAIAVLPATAFGAQFGLAGLLSAGVGVALMELVLLLWLTARKRSPHRVC